MFYVIRENRTYDRSSAIFEQGNGDPTLTLFGADITPNAHAIAQNFVLFDNFYVDADVSYDGHAFSTAAYATDFVQKIWQTYYGTRGALYLGEGGGFMRNPFGNISAPTRRLSSGTTRIAPTSASAATASSCDNSARAPPATSPSARPCPACIGAIAPTFAAFDLSITDRSGSTQWNAEFQAYVANGKLPQLSIIHLGNDHTDGTTPGMPTPRAMVADNDLALGRLVETISQQRLLEGLGDLRARRRLRRAGPTTWIRIARSLLVASPFAKRGFVDHTFYTTSGMLRTIELILGLPPMSLYDAARHADVQRVSADAEPGALHEDSAEPRVRRGQHGQFRRRGAVAGDGFFRRRSDARTAAERDSLALREGRPADAPASPQRVRHSALTVRASAFRRTGPIR